MSDTNLFDFSTFPALATARLTLRRLRASDAADVLVFRGDWEVQKFNGPVFQDAQGVQTLIEELRDEYGARAGITWAVTLKDSDTVVGLFGLHHWNKRHRRAEAGYDLARPYWGRGIASEALRAIVQFGFERMNLNRIYASTIAANHRSVRLLERLGFQREGTKRQHVLGEGGTFHDGVMYSLLRREYVMQARTD